MKTSYFQRVELQKALKDGTLQCFINAAEHMSGYAYRAPDQFDASNVFKVGEFVYASLVKRLDQGDDLGVSREMLVNRAKECNRVCGLVFEFEAAGRVPDEDPDVVSFITEAEKPVDGASAKSGLATDAPATNGLGIDVSNALVLVVNAVLSGRMGIFSTGRAVSVPLLV